MASLPVRDPIGDHLLTPQNSALLVVVRSIGGLSSSSSASSGTVGCPRPVATLIVEWTIGTPKAFAVFTVETMFSSSRSRSMDWTPAN
jgi:hypothetical protein